MSEKQYLDAQQLLEDSFRLGARIIKDGFRPTIMIAIWRGGVPMGTLSPYLDLVETIQTRQAARTNGG